MKPPCKRKERHGQIQALTLKHLNQLTQQDLRTLAEYADRRLARLLGHFSAEDAVQKALLSIIRGAQKSGKGRLPHMESLRTKTEFLHYVRSAINSVVEAMKRTRELSFIHEIIYREKDPEDEGKSTVLTALPSPDQDSSLVDLKNELFARLRKVAAAELRPTIDEWERTFFWASMVPVRRNREYQRRVRKLAKRVLKRIATDLGV